jgi:hypothetical protein
MDIVRATAKFEGWLRKAIPAVDEDLAFKHQQMRADPFFFFRGTFYRWAQLWPKVCPDLARGQIVLAVGDLHLENFGTWRDAEGRLAWGVNDFDEAHPMAFANDLVRLAVSALLCLQVDPALKLKSSDIFARLTRGYGDALAAGGEPVILMEKHPELRRMALQESREPAQFWTRLKARTVKLNHELPDGLRKIFRRFLPEGVKPVYRIFNPPKGLGSLGRRRYLAIAEWEGGLIAREAKDVVPSACLWAARERPRRGNRWLKNTVEHAVRSADPCYGVKGRWLVRRLAPDCSRIDLEQLKHHEDLASLLHAMGWETANIHLGTPRIARKLAKAFARLPKSWLRDASGKMFRHCLDDWHQFRDGAGRADRA